MIASATTTEQGIAAAKTFAFVSKPLLSQMPDSS